MASARTPGKWPYKAAKPGRTRRVIKTRGESAPGGVVRASREPPKPVITPGRARLVLAIAFVSAIVAGSWWAYHSPYLTVQRVTVNGVTSRSAQEVRAAAALDGQSGFSLDTASAQARVAALTGVRSAKVTQHGWNAVTIDVEERAVWGSWRIGATDIPIDAEGYVLGGVAAPPGAPVIIEWDPQRVVNVGDRLDTGAVQLAARLVRESKTAFGRDVVSLIYKQSSGLTAVLSSDDGSDGKLWATFGDSRDYDYKVAALYVLLQQARDSDVAVNTVDLRFGDRLTFN